MCEIYQSTKIGNSQGSRAGCKLKVGLRSGGVTKDRISEMADMNTRVKALLFALTLTLVFGLGVFLLVVADEMPAPGLILMAISVVVAVGRWGAGRSDSGSPSSAFDAMERDRESYEHDAERRRSQISIHE